MAKSESTAGNGHEAVIDAVAAADEDYRDVERRIEAVGETTVERVAETLSEAESLLDRYEGRATGTGGEEFREFVRMKQDLTTFVEGLDDDLRHRDAFEAAREALDKRRVSESDFERARSALDPARETANLLDERRKARERYRDTRRRLRETLESTRERIAELERVRRYGEADLDASVERLREPIEAYNEAVRSGFEEFRRSAPAREVLSLVRTTEQYPLVDYRQPPEDLFAYVESDPAGERSVTTLLEYADYSRSKLAHYVDSPDRLKRRVATERTYLERLSADPLTVEWPPPSADLLRHQGRELVAVVGRFADESVVERARTVHRLAFRDDYDRLREAAVARARLTETDRRRLASGAVETELADLRERREELQSALEEYPSR